MKIYLPVTNHVPVLEFLIHKKLIINQLYLKIIIIIILLRLKKIKKINQLYLKIIIINHIFLEELKHNKVKLIWITLMICLATNRNNQNKTPIS